jgi:hypothetical protein
MDWSIVSQSCNTNNVEFTACRGMVAYYSPNNESFLMSGSGVTSARNLGWNPPNPVMDPEYPTFWQGLVVQTMPDLLQSYAPPCPCGPQYHYNSTDDVYEFRGYDCVQYTRWTEDDGTCRPDNPGSSDPDFGTTYGDDYYHHTPFFEAVCDFSASTPPLRPGVKVGCINVPVGDCNKGNFCAQPQAPHDFTGPVGQYSPRCGVANDYLGNYVIENPWILLLNEEGCVCADGRFKDWYIRNGVFCVPNIVPPP